MPELLPECSSGTALPLEALNRDLTPTTQTRTCTHHNTRNGTHPLRRHFIETQHLALLEWQGMRCSFHIPCHEISHESLPLQLDVLLLLPGMIEDADIDDDEECDTPPSPCSHGAASTDEGVDMLGVSCMRFMLSAS